MARRAIRDEAALRTLFPPTSEMATRKVLRRIDPHAAAFIARSPFLTIGTQSSEGRADVSPRGDAPGFVRVLDERTLLIPDRPGNRRLDTLSNVIANPALGLLFLIPGFDETLRVNGRGTVTDEPALLALTEVGGRRSTVAIHIVVEEVFLHCAKALRRSRLWDPASLQDRAGMPSLMRMLLDQTGGTTEEAERARLDADLERRYGDTMY
ncbi:hypothetical protein BCF33_0086 [Hasllibacter halocynthiae]|uniref:Pyridoxamine 5'-phosphate oxidase N-terminal domain-containing protein n=2 Tax=Hasllibacter halocynthiae TaxID=595589 RepID=A0A2T0X6H7_9RHOB|nr:hypothetical protein BCF33_0086 [Hasllibacter halocynthiae]